jgi:hypothetical protein
MSLPWLGKANKIQTDHETIYTINGHCFAWDFHYLLIGLVCDLVVEKV